MREWANRGIPA